MSTPTQETHTNMTPEQQTPQPTAQPPETYQHVVVATIPQPSGWSQGDTSHRMCMGCGAMIQANIKICPHCGNNPFYQAKKSSYASTAGILYLLGSFSCLLLGVGYLAFTSIPVYDSNTSSYDIKLNYFALVAGTVNVLAFGLGISSYIFATKLENYNIVVAGGLLIILAGILSLIGCAFGIVIVVGVIPLVMGVLGTIFVYVSQKDFIAMGK